MNYLKHALIFGIFSGFVCYAWFLTVYSFGINPFFSFWANLVILFVGGTTFFSIYMYAKSLQTFSFGQGLFLGGFTNMITGIFCCLCIYLSTTYVIPNAIEIYRNESLLHLLSNKQNLIKESSITIFNTYLQSIPNIDAQNSSIRYFISNIIIPGLMFTILSSLPLRKKLVVL